MAVVLDDEFPSSSSSSSLSVLRMLDFSMDDFVNASRNLLCFVDTVGVVINADGVLFNALVKFKSSWRYTLNGRRIEIERRQKTQSK